MSVTLPFKGQGQRGFVEENYIPLMSPLSTQRWGHIALPLSAQSVSVYARIHFSPALSIVQAVKHETLTQCWANVGPLPTRLSQHYPSTGIPCRVWRHAECGTASQTAGQH